MPRHNLRRIKVAGIEYLWAVKPHSVNPSHFVRVVIFCKHEGGRDSTLTAVLRFDDPWINISSVPEERLAEQRSQPITPMLAQALISKAIDLGWDPSKPGSTISLTDDDVSRDKDSI